MDFSLLVVLYSQKERRQNNTFLYKYICLFLFLSTETALNASVGERNRERETKTDVGLRGLLYWPCLISHHLFPYSIPHLAVLLLPSRGGGHCSLWALTDRSLWLTVSDWLRDWPFWRRYPCIYDFITLPRVHPVVNPHDLLTPKYCLFPGNQFVYTCTSCVEKSLIGGSVKGQ